MRIPKKYGFSKTTACPFCERTSTLKNPQGLDVCHKHKDQLLPEIKCLCGSWLEIRSGKFGPYFNCPTCGNLSFQKAMTIKATTQPTLPKEKTEPKQPSPKKEPKEIIITTNDVEYF